jgi:hypothetical protein
MRFAPLPDPPAPPMTMNPRHQAPALLERGPEPGHHPCGAGINPVSAPRTPREAGNTRSTRPRGATGTGCIAFPDAGMRRERLEPVDAWLQTHGPLGSTKRRARFAKAIHPRVGLFFPRVGPFYPRVCFQPIRHAAPPLSLFFRRRREREGGQERGKTIPRVGLIGEKLYPRVGHPIHVFSVAQNSGRTQQWRGFAADRASIHASTGCAAPGWTSRPSAGGAHG